MNGWTTRACVTAVLLAGLAAAAPAQVDNNDQAEVLLQEARHKALVDGDLERAIELCKKIVAEHGGNRAVAAKALVLIGQCHEKLGKAEARKAYQRVIQDYADQREQTAVARARLSALGHAPSSATTTGMTIRRVSDLAHLWPCDVSSDGRYVFFQDRKTGDLSVRDLVTGKDRRLTKNEDPEQATGNGALSHDGKRVAYGWRVGPESMDLRLIGFDGSDPRVLYRHEELEDIDPVGWTSDGGHILVKLRRKDRTVQIAWIAVADGSLRVLKTLHWEDRSAHVYLSPDGRYVAYDHHEDDVRYGPENIFVLAVDGSREIPLVKHPSDDDLVGWGPDGKWVLFRSDRTGTDSLWAIPVADGKPQGSPQLVKRDIGSINQRGVTRGGAFYYIARGSTSILDVHIASLDPATGKVLTRPTRATQRFKGSTFAPAWSPDGKSLAYLVRARPDACIIRIRSLETGEERELPPRLAARWSRGFGPAMHWSPDGRSILLKVGRGCQQVDVQTGEVASLVTTVGHFGQGVLSSDGNLFFLSLTRENETTIVRRNLATGEERELIRIPHATGPFFALSPDERHLVFADPMVSQATALKIIPAAGGEVRELLSLKEPTKQYISQEAGFAWSPDGSHVYFGRRSEWPKRTLCRIPVEGGEPQVVGLEIERLSELRIHPDGQRIAFTANHQQWTSELWVMENFLPTLKAGK